MRRTLVREIPGRVASHTYTIEFWAGKVAEVDLIDYPSRARETLARTTRGYTGNYDMVRLTEDEISKNLHALKNTKLGTPTEMLNFVFLIRNVPRSWTHQAVRTRIGAAVVQESTRFIGAKDVYRILVPPSLCHGTAGINTAYSNQMIKAIRTYEWLLVGGEVDTQDARMVLPHSILTHMFWSLNLKALMGIYEVRWCCQAEPSTWMPIMKQMKILIERSCGSEIAAFLSSPILRGESCGFNASFDRPCSWKVL